MAKKKLLIAAVIVAAFAAGLVYLAIEQQNEKTEELLKNRVDVIEAARNIPAGTELSKDHVTVDKVPKQFLPHNALLKSDLEVYLGQPIKRDIKEGKMIVTSDFRVEEAADSLAAKIPSDERAMSLSVDSVSGVSGLLRPGDRVDIIGTFPLGSEEEAIPEAGGGTSVGYVTMTLLQNVTLLAVGKSIARASGREGTNYSNVTLSVTVEEAELLTIAQTRGDLNLLLRNSEDVQIDPIKRKKLKTVLENLEVINQRRQERQEKRPDPQPPQRETTSDEEEDDEDIEIIRGD